MAERPMRDAALALSLLTVVPVRAQWPNDASTRVAGWFPAVGLLLGAVGYGVAKGAEGLGATSRAPFVVAAVIVCVWALSTRLLHWDGLADVADGYWGAHEQARRLEIMSDSHTGAFGAAAIALVAITQVAAVAAILSAPHELPLVAIPAIGRLAATAAAWFGTPARPSGLGRSVMARPSGVSALFAIVAVAGALAVLGYALGLPGAVAGVAGAVCALGVPHVLAQRFGGVTGDVMGASVILTETLLLVAVALVA